MGILSGPEIVKAVKDGRILVDPFVYDNVGPNSVDLRLAPKLLLYTTLPIDAKKLNPVEELIVSESGTLLVPGKFYLGHTVEKAGSDHYVPCIEGRSSLARLGLSPHVSAGFGDHGFKSQWTLEITVELPMLVYPNMRICQVFFHELIGDKKLYSGKYVDSVGVVESKSFLDFK